MKTNKIERTVKKEDLKPYSKFMNGAKKFVMGAGIISALLGGVNPANAQMQIKSSTIYFAPIRYDGTEISSYTYNPSESIVPIASFKLKHNQLDLNKYGTSAKNINAVFSDGLKHLISVNLDRESEYNVFDMKNNTGIVDLPNMLESYKEIKNDESIDLNSHILDVDVNIKRKENDLVLYAKTELFHKGNVVGRKYEINEVFLDDLTLNDEDIARVAKGVLVNLNKNKFERTSISYLVNQLRNARLSVDSYNVRIKTANEDVTQVYKNQRDIMKAEYELALSGTEGDLLDANQEIIELKEDISSLSNIIKQEKGKTKRYKEHVEKVEEAYDNKLETVTKEFTEINRNRDEQMGTRYRTPFWMINSLDWEFGPFVTTTLDFNKLNGSYKSAGGFFRIDYLNKGLQLKNYLQFEIDNDGKFTGDIKPANVGFRSSSFGINITPEINLPRDNITVMEMNTNGDWVKSYSESKLVFNPKLGIDLTFGGTDRLNDTTLTVGGKVTSTISVLDINGFYGPTHYHRKMSGLEGNVNLTIPLKEIGSVSLTGTMGKRYFWKPSYTVDLTKRNDLYYESPPKAYGRFDVEVDLTGKKLSPGTRLMFSVESTPGSKPSYTSSIALPLCKYNYNVETIRKSKRDLPTGRNEELPFDK